MSNIPLWMFVVACGAAFINAMLAIGLDVLAWRADDELTRPVNDDPEYLRALFNTESAWAAAQNSAF